MAIIADYTNTPKLASAGLIQPTSGAGSAGQLVSGTVVRSAATGINLTAPAAIARRVSIRLGSQASVKMKKPRMISEAAWRKAVSQERKKARRKGISASNVDSSLEAIRYGR